MRIPIKMTKEQHALLEKDNTEVKTILDAVEIKPQGEGELTMQEFYKNLPVFGKR